MDDYIAERLTRSTAALKEVPTRAGLGESLGPSNEAMVGSGSPPHDAVNHVAGTQAPPVDTTIVGKRRGRPQTITDMKAYKRDKERSRRAKLKEEKK